MKSSRISALAAWALAFGCAIGWDAIVLPWTTFLPMAGPVGMTIGILIGAVAMGVVAWNYHYMINRNPGPGGAYTYAAKAFGSDHGFICAWFLCLVYTAIVWMDAVTNCSCFKASANGSDAFLYFFDGAPISFNVTFTPLSCM